MVSTRKIFICVFVICLFSTTILGTLCFAQVPDDVRKAASEGIGNFKGSLASDSAHFGINSSDKKSIDTDLHLGEGFEEYQFSSSDITTEENTSTNIKLDKAFSSADEYIFPVKIGNKEIAVAYVDKENGKYVIYRVSGYNSFEADIAATEEKIKNKLNKADISKDIILVYDYPTNLMGLGFKGSSEDYFIPIKENGLNLDKDEIKPVSECITKLSESRKLMKENSLGKGGSPGTSAKTGTMPNTNIIILLLVCAIALATGLIIFRSKRSNLKNN